MLLTDAGGIIDDFMVTRPFEGQGTLGLIVNAGRKDIDDAHIEARLPPGVKLVKAEDRALLALQGPQAAPVLARHCPGSAAMTFMTARTVKIAGFACTISRSGYTGEDGYEISVHAEDAVRLAEILLAEPEVLPIGLGARDSLRLEAGLCLYGHDIDETTSPVEAALTWAIGKRRKMEKNFPGADRIMGELFDGAPRKRVGIQPLEKAPAREGTVIMNSAGGKIGTITSGGFGPAVNAPIAMGYVTGEFAADGTDVQLLVRGTPRPARIVPMPFAPHRYHRG
jgi:aminomethyltransferase